MARAKVVVQGHSPGEAKIAGDALEVSYLPPRNVSELTGAPLGNRANGSQEASQRLQAELKQDYSYLTLEKELDPDFRTEVKTLALVPHSARQRERARHVQLLLAKTPAVGPLNITQGAGLTLVTHRAGVAADAGSPTAELLVLTDDRASRWITVSDLMEGRLPGLLGVRAGFAAINLTIGEYLKALFAASPQAD